MSDYPEHDKLAKISDKSQAIDDFLTWLQDERGYELAEWGTSERMIPIGHNIEFLLAEYFEIDRDKIEAEKQQMLAAMREMNR